MKKLRLLGVGVFLGVMSACNAGRVAPAPTPLETIVATANVAEPITVS
jgi:hypothetical protein